MQYFSDRHPDLGISTYFETNYAYGNIHFCWNPNGRAIDQNALHLPKTTITSISRGQIVLLCMVGCYIINMTFYIFLQN